MIKNYLFLLPVFCAFLIISSCTKDDPILDANSTVEIYSLESFETIGNTPHINEKTVILAQVPLIEYEDIESYNAKDYIFSFSENAKSIIKTLPHSGHQSAFAVVANNELIYTAYFWAGYSSLSCDWITMDPTGIEYRGEGFISVGYPGPLPGSNIVDNRNDPRILGIFRRDHKLIE